MCHLVLLMPFIGLAIFWVSPMSVAVPAYLVILALSIWVYWYVMKSVYWPVQTGIEKIRRGTGTVITVEDSHLTVSMNGEIWNAESPDRLAANDKVEVFDIQGLVLKVRSTKST